jgi:hypothetical protein
MCMGFDHDHSHDLVRRLFDYTEQTFDQRFLGFFVLEVAQNSSPNSLVTSSHLN